MFPIEILQASVENDQHTENSWSSWWKHD